MNTKNEMNNNQHDARGNVAPRHILPEHSEVPSLPSGGGGGALRSRGLRNNNPLNIRHSGSKWKGMAIEQKDAAFVQFIAPAYGYRAAFCLLRTYRTKYGCDTIRKIIRRWAPPNENNTESYIRHVSEWSRLEPDKPIAAHDANAYINIVCAMSRMENGVEAKREDVVNGWMLFER